MPNPRTPSTSDYSTLETQKRNDNTTTSNSTTIPPEYPDKSTGNEFEVERRNEVYPGQTHGTELTEDEKLEKKTDSEIENQNNNDDKKNDSDEDWDMTKQNKEK